MDPIVKVIEKDGLTLEIRYDQHFSWGELLADTDVLVLAGNSDFGPLNDHIDVRPWVPWGEGYWENAYGSEEPPEEPRAGVSAWDHDNAVDLWEEREWRRREEKECYAVFPVRINNYGGGNYRIVFSEESDCHGHLCIRTSGLSPMAMLKDACEDVSPYERAKQLRDYHNEILEGSVYFCTLKDRNGDVLDCVGGIVGWEWALEYANDLLESALKQEIGNGKSVAHQHDHVQFGPPA
jgi:hypothetical protein